MKIVNHILQDVIYKESPNFNDRPHNQEINLIVIHSISLPPKIYNSNHIEKFFLNKLDFSLHSFYQEIERYKGFGAYLNQKIWRSYSVCSF